MVPFVPVKINPFRKEVFSMNIMALLNALPGSVAQG